MSGTGRIAVGLYGGSYNPLHRGHLAVARHAVESGVLSQVWLTVSPENPFKHEAQMAPAADRLAMAELGVRDVGLSDIVKVSDVELSMPRPSYTIDTLRLLAERYPEVDFKVVIGADNVADFHKWKDWERIVSDYGVVVYPRPGYELERIPFPCVVLEGCPESDASSTEVRRLVRDGDVCREQLLRLVEPSVAEYILSSHLYERE